MRAAMAVMQERFDPRRSRTKTAVRFLKLPKAREPACAFYATALNSAALPPAAVVLTVTVCSAQKR